MHRTLPILVVIIFVAGCTSAPSHSASALDTGDIAPTSADDLTFHAVGDLQIHCHPHPWMIQNVTITDDAPAEIHVHIIDGIDENEYRYEPANLTVGAGTRVTYHNHGN